MQRLSIVIATSLVLVLLVLSGLYLSTPLLLSWQIDKLIQQQGCESFTGEFQRPTWTQLAASRLTLNNCPNGIQHLDLNNLLVEYRPEELFKTQRLQSISIDSITVDYHQLDSSSGGTFPLVLPSELFQQLPLNRLQIGNADLSITTPHGVIEVQGSSSLDTDKLITTLVANITPDSAFELQPISLNFDVSLDRKNHFEISIADSLTQLYHISGSAELTDDQLSINANDQAKLEPLINWIKQTGISADFVDLILKGTIENQWQISLQIPESKNDLAFPGIKQSVALQLEQTEGIHPNLEQLTGTLNGEIRWLQDHLIWQLGPNTLINTIVDPSLLPDPAISNKWQASTEDLRGTIYWQELKFQTTEGQLNLVSNDPLKPNIEAALSQLYHSQKLTSSRFNALFDSPNTNSSDITLKELEGRMNGLFAIHDNDISLKLNKGSHFQAKQLTYNTLALSKPKVAFTKAVDIRAAFSEKLWQMSPIEMSIAAGQSKVFEYSVNAFNGLLTINPNKELKKKVSGNLNATFHQLAINNSSENNLDIGSLKVNSPFTLNYPKLYLAPSMLWPTDAEAPIQVSSKFNYRLDKRNGHGSFQIKPSPIRELTQTPLIKPILEQHQLTNLQGTVSGKGDIALSAKGQKALWKTTAKVTLDDIGLNWQKWSAESFKANLNTSVSYRGIGATEVDLSGAKMQGITELSDIELNTTYLADKQQLLVDTARVKVLGGNVKAKPFSVDLKTLAADLQLEIEKVQLPELLKLQTNQDIQASGLIHGHIPISVKAGQPSVSFGYVSSAEPGGKLAYTPPNAEQLASNPGMKIALQAMNNFHYHHLSAQVHYQPDGTLWLDTALKGHNPDWQNGQPIDFNIRIEQNLLKLLQALQFSDNLSEGLDQQIRQRMQ